MTIKIAINILDDLAHELVIRKGFSPIKNIYVKTIIIEEIATH